MDEEDENFAPGPPPLVPVPGVDRRITKYEANPRHRELVAMMVANRVSNAIIAQSLNISKPTLERHYHREIRNGREQITARVGVGVLRKALKGNMNAARFWLMTHGGPEWRLSRNDAAAEAAVFATPTSEQNGRRVNFYLPVNGRDQPEEGEGPTIDGEADEDAA